MCTYSAAWSPTVPSKTPTKETSSRLSTRGTSVQRSCAGWVEVWAAVRASQGATRQPSGTDTPSACLPALSRHAHLLLLAATQLAAAGHAQAANVRGRQVAADDGADGRGAAAAELGRLRGAQRCRRAGQAAQEERRHAALHAAGSGLRALRGAAARGRCARRRRPRGRNSAAAAAGSSGWQRREPRARRGGARWWGRRWVGGSVEDAAKKR